MKNTMNEMHTAIENCMYAQYCRGEKSSKPEKKIPVMFQMNEDGDMKKSYENHQAPLEEKNMIMAIGEGNRSYSKKSGLEK